MRLYLYIVCFVRIQGGRKGMVIPDIRDIKGM